MINNLSRHQIDRKIIAESAQVRREGDSIDASVTPKQNQSLGTLQGFTDQDILQQASSELQNEPLPEQRKVFGAQSKHNEDAVVPA